MRSNPEQITLLLPDLFSRPESLPEQPLPALERILARASRERLPAGATLVQCLAGEGLAPPLPLAALAALGAGLEPGVEPCLFADPVHLLPNREHLVLLAGESLALEEGEAEALLAALGEHFADRGWRLYRLDAQRWLLRGVEVAGLATTPLPQALGRNVAGLLPTGPDARRWRAWLNEAQMLLHGHPVNARRRERGLAEINSLWLWGEGRLPQPAAAGAGAMLWADDVVARGLACWRGGQCRPLPADAGPVIAAGGGQVVLGPVLEPRWYDDWQGLEQAWCAPLLDALAAGRYRRLTVVTGGWRFELNKAGLRRFWRRGRSLRYWARQWGDGS